MKALSSVMLYSLMLFAIAIIPFVTASPTQGTELTKGEKVFNAYCASCHFHGSTAVIASKSLKKEALEEYGVASQEAIKKWVTEGNDAMPAFGSRLNAIQLEEVANYVLQQSQKGW